METYNIILNIVTILKFLYSLIIVPRSLGEMKGIYMETPDEFYGKFAADCKWTHGTTYAIGALSYIIIIPILVLIYEQIMNKISMTAAVITILIILIPLKIYYQKQKQKKKKKAYQKNIEDGYIKHTETMPNTEGQLKKIYKKITKKK